MTYVIITLVIILGITPQVSPAWIISFGEPVALPNNGAGFIEQNRRRKAVFDLIAEDYPEYMDIDSDDEAVPANFSAN